MEKMFPHTNHPHNSLPAPREIEHKPIKIAFDAKSYTYHRTYPNPHPVHSEKIIKVSSSLPSKLLVILPSPQSIPQHH